MIKVAFFDFSKTVMQNGPADIIGDYMGRPEVREELKRQYKEGKITKPEMSVKSAICYKGFLIEEIEKIKDQFITNPNIKECLEALKEKGITNVLVSNAQIQVLERICKSKELPFDIITGSNCKIVDGIMTGEDLAFRKPKAETVKDKIIELGFTKEEAIAIGDSPDDATMFPEVGIGVLYRPDEHAKGMGDYEINDFMELIEIVEKENSK